MSVESCAWLGDARSLPWGDESVDCIVTSPPYADTVGRRVAEHLRSAPRRCPRPARPRPTS